MHLNVIPLFLVLLILLGVLSNNGSITISATVLLLIQQPHCPNIFLWPRNWCSRRHYLFDHRRIKPADLRQNTDTQPDGLYEPQNVRCRRHWYFGRMDCRTRNSVNECPTDSGYRPTYRHDHRRCLLGRGSCRPSDCRWLIVVFRRKNLVYASP